MRLIPTARVVVECLSCVGALASVTIFTINLCSSHMLQLVFQGQLPANEEYAGLGGSLGIDLVTLKLLQQQWTTSFSWSNEQAALNKWV